MKTYSRKSSSYLKKAFVASNFNEMCRLCLSEVDMVLTPIIQDSQMSYQEWIQYSVDVLVEEGDGLPPNICEECLGMVEQTYLFKKKCKASDAKLREHLQLLDFDECRMIDAHFDSTSKKSESPVKEVETGPAAPDPDTVDPGGAETPNENSHSEKKTIADEEQNSESINIKNHKSVSKEKDTVKPINEDNIIINEIKRYVWKNESTGEEEVTVCQVVHYDIRKEGEDSNDEDENNENSLVQSISSTDILEEYSNNLKDLPEESPQHHDGAEKNHAEQGEVSEKSEGKIQEICQLWDNDDEEGEPAEEDEDEEEEEEEEEEEIHEEEEEQEEGLVVDVSWDEDGSQKLDSVNAKVVEVNLEENGVMKTHKVYATENCIQLIKTDSDGSELRCFVCYKPFETKIQMRNHLMTSHREPTNNSVCEICLKNFTSANSLKRHMLVHTGVKPYGCDICGRKFSQTSILKRHRFTHGKKKPFECTFCQKSYTQKMNLLTHLRNHGIKTEPVDHRCKLCHKTFVHPSGLSRHLKQHKGVRFCCSHCNKSFSDSSALARHIKSAHF